MIDLHCHLLPGIDDGPKTLDDALAMARVAVANGITKAVVTPHIHPGRYDNERSSITHALGQFKTALQDAEIPLVLGMSAEVRISPEILSMVQQDRLPFLGEVDGYRLILLEMPHSHIPPGSDKMVRWLLANKIRPVIAHPERNKDVIRDVEKIAPFVQQGCLLQVTAGAVAGRFGPLARLRADQLLGRGWVSILASDAHNLDARPPELEPGRAAAERIVGKDESWALVRERPLMLAGGQFC